jgi:MOSC domain-containing protein YiiM
MLEVLQGRGGVRHAEWLDALCNAGGVLLGVAVARTPCGRLLERMDQGLQWLF